jgi:hypothetical protein
MAKRAFFLNIKIPSSAPPVILGLLIFPSTDGRAAQQLLISVKRTPQDPPANLQRVNEDGQVLSCYDRSRERPFIYIRKP